MTITEIYNTAEKLKEDINYINNMVDEVSTKLARENNTPDRWVSFLTQLHKDLRDLQRDADAWKVEKMTKKLVEAMARGRMNEQRMIEISKFIEEE